MYGTLKEQEVLVHNPLKIKISVTKNVTFLNPKTKPNMDSIFVLCRDVTSLRYAYINTLMEL